MKTFGASCLNRSLLLPFIMNESYAHENPSEWSQVPSLPSLTNQPIHSCLTAVPQREAGHQLQPEAEGEVPVPPAGQTHHQAPAPSQGPPPPEEGAAGHERGAPQEVRLSFFFFFFSGAKPLVCAAKVSVASAASPA